MAIVSFENSYETPLNNCKEMEFWPEDEHTDHGSVMIAKSKLQRMGILTRNTNRMYKFMMLLMDPLVSWEPFRFAVQHSMGHVETEVFTND